MNIKTKLILAATAVSLLATPALAFRDEGDEGGNSAFAIPPNGNGNSRMYYNGTNGHSAYGFAPIQRNHRGRPSHRRR
jgi:hypothetical protein